MTPAVVLIMGVSASGKTTLGRALAERFACRFVDADDLLHKDVCHPGRREPYTVEKALQVYFVHYWQRHLALMRQVEGVAGQR